jgi:arginyl-tRNA synthetase
MDYIKNIAKSLSKLCESDENEIAKSIETPANAALGDFAFPCHKLSKALRKAPNVIAKEFEAAISLPEGFQKAEAAGPYLNFFVDKPGFARHVLESILAAGEDYGKGNEGIGADKNVKTVTIDYSSPNVTHEFHIGHLFSTVIGAALYRLHNFLGYRAIGINYLGDWGSQFGKLIFAYKEWSAPEEVEKKGLDELTRVYVKYHEEESRDEGLKAKAREWLVRLEAGDGEAVAAWRMIRDICLASMNKTYERLGISFDSYKGESHYNDKMDAIVDELREKGLLTESDGAMIVDLEEYKMPVCLILRKDGGTLYPTRDIAAALGRKKEFGFHKSLYVTDVRQSLHFAQWFKVVALMGYEWAQDMVHIPYGLLSLESGALSARKGNVVYLEDFFDESVSRILSIINEKNEELEGKEEVAEAVGVGAVVFWALYTSNIKDKVFSWEAALNFDGETGPYVQYTHARASSVLEKARGLDGEEADYSGVLDENGFALIKALWEFPAKVRLACEKYEPFILSRHLVHVAQCFNKFYHYNPIIQSEGPVRAARLELVACTKHVLKSGLALIGLKAPLKM